MPLTIQQKQQSLSRTARELRAWRNEVSRIMKEGAEIVKRHSVNGNAEFLNEVASGDPVSGDLDAITKEQYTALLSAVGSIVTRNGYQTADQHMAYVGSMPLLDDQTLSDAFDAAM